MVDLLGRWNGSGKWLH